MATDKSRTADTIAVEVNDDPVEPYAPEELDQRHLEDCKGPDEAQWEVERDEPEFDPGDPEATRHDDPQFGPDGSIESSNVVTHVKGPGPEWPPAPE